MITTKTVLAAIGLSLIAGAAAADEFDQYIGRYPYEAVNGTSFFDHPKVREAIVYELGEAEYEGIKGLEIQSPISGDSEVVVAHACRQHDCGNVNVTIVMWRNGELAITCIGKQEAESWYVPFYDGALIPLQGQPEPCPSEVAAMWQRVDHLGGVQAMRGSQELRAKAAARAIATTPPSSWQSHRHTTNDGLTFVVSYPPDRFTYQTTSADNTGAYFQGSDARSYIWATSGYFNYAQGHTMDWAYQGYRDQEAREEVEVNRGDSEISYVHFSASGDTLFYGRVREDCQGAAWLWIEVAIPAQTDAATAQAAEEVTKYYKPDPDPADNCF